MKRIFVLDSHPNKEIHETSFIVACHKQGLTLGKDLEVVISEEPASFLKHLPEGYDCYVLHPSDTSEEAITELRERQPGCSVVALRGGAFELGIQNRQTYDVIYPLFGSRECESIITALTLNP